MAASSTRSSGPGLRSLPGLRPLSPSPRCHRPSPSAPSNSSTFFTPRSPLSAPVAVSARTVAPGRPISSIGQTSRSTPRRRTCMCSPTTHPGSFVCSLHRGVKPGGGGHHAPSTHLNARRSAMTNSLVRICSSEGDLVKRALAALIRPSSHHQRRRADFRPRPSRLSVMSKGEDS